MCAAGELRAGYQVSMSKKRSTSRQPIDRRRVVRNKTSQPTGPRLRGRRNHAHLRRPPPATRTPILLMSTSEENKYNPGILLTSCLLHSFIQGIIISQAGRYYEDYFHLDKFSMKSYVGTIVAVSSYVSHLRHPSRHLEAYPGNPSAQTTYISYKAWTVILLRDGQSPTVPAVTSTGFLF